MKLLSRLFPRKPVPKTEEEIAALIEGFADGTIGPRDWDCFISADFENERIKWAETECFKAEQEFPPTGRMDWCNEEGLNSLQAIVSELRAARHADSDHDVIHPVARSPEFSVDVQLSDAARKKLIDNKETIVVLGSFMGHPKNSTEARFLDKAGFVFLGRVGREIRPGETATFEPMNFNPDAFARIDSRATRIFIEVSSGRRSSRDNLLDCKDHEGSFESVLGRTMVLRCQLIEERFAGSGR